jgi:hypothetical protein
MGDADSLAVLIEELGPRRVLKQVADTKSKGCWGGVHLGVKRVRF